MAQGMKNWKNMSEKKYQLESWNRMKKFLIGGLCLAAAVMVCLAVVFSRGAAGKSGENPDSGKLNVVTTLFPYYDFVRQIAGSEVELTLVVPAGMDSHSFEPTPADMRIIQNADVLICNGGTMEQWLDDVLGAIDTSQMRVVTMMDYVDTVEEETVEGMEDSHDHEETYSGGGSYIDHDGHEAEIEYDEHIWTSPVNAMKLAEMISRELAGCDPANAAVYNRNKENYLAELEKLHQELTAVSDARKRNMIVVGDKFPFRYLADTYHLDYRAAFSGCSTDTEPSARTIAYLIDKVRTGKIPVIYYLELSSHRVAEIIGEETGAQPLLLHSCHSVTRAEFDRGVTYLQLMEQNVENLRKGLDE